MMIHWIRPWWFLSFLPFLILAWYWYQQRPVGNAWQQVCDAHLLPYLMQKKQQVRYKLPIGSLFLSIAFMLFSLAGPAWVRLPVPTYQPIQPRVVVLEMTEAMRLNDLSPDRLSRAKFKLHDLFQQKNQGQFGLVVYTGEPFVVSPLTDDGQTIDALLSSLDPEIMPVAGENLATALEQAGKLILEAGFQHGQILVLASTTPSAQAITTAQLLAQQGIHTSVIPILGDETSPHPLFKKLAQAGQGDSFPLSDTSQDLDDWLKFTQDPNQFQKNQTEKVAIWRDEGRWFLIPALLFLLPIFRRGWLQEVRG